MRVFRVALTLGVALAVLLASISLAGVLRKKVNFTREPEIIVNTNYDKYYHEYLGPYYQLWESGGYTFVGTVQECTVDEGTQEEQCRNLSDDEIGELAAYYYENVSHNFWNFKSWLEEQGYKVTDWSFHSEDVIALANQLIQNAREDFLQELATAYAGVNFSYVGSTDDPNDLESTGQWPGRATGIYNVKSGTYQYYGVKQVGIIQVNINATMSYRTDAVVMKSPIVLDLDGNGKLDSYNGHYLPIRDLSEVRANQLKMVPFDIDGTNYEVMVEWIGPNDGYLVMPNDPAKTLETGILTADEFFGTAGGYTDGYSKLSLLDRNNDGLLTGAELEGLYVFQDKNVNGRVEKGELISLKDLGITEISLKHENYKSYFVMNGERRAMWDFWPITLSGRKLSK